MSVYSKLNTGNEIAEVLSAHIRGKTVLVTGGTLGGLGTEFVATIVRHDPKLVILTARSQAKIDESFAYIRKTMPQAPLRSLLLDLSSMEDVRRGAAEINGYPEVVDVVLHNAAIAGIPHTLTKEGLEVQFATNHIGPFLLTKLLLSRMLTGPSKPRFVIVGSGAHKMLQGEFPWDDPNGNTSYPATKVLNHLFAPALVRKSAGKVDAFSLSPGWVASQLSRHLSVETKTKMGFFDEDGVSPNPGLGSLPYGILPYVVAGFDPDLPTTAPGTYVNSDGQVDPDGLAEYAKGIEREEKMWALSETTIGEKFVL